MKKLLVLVFSCVVFIAASGNVFAAPIVYTISGTLDVSLNGGPFENKLVTWNFSADTDDVKDFAGTDTVPAMKRIYGITGTVEIEHLLPETQLAISFDIGASMEDVQFPGVALSLPGGTSPIVWLVQYTETDLVNYDLTEIDQVTCNIFGAPFNGPYMTSKGDEFTLSSLNVPISFEATMVPIPSSLLLLGAGLAGLAGLRKKFSA